MRNMVSILLMIVLCIIPALSNGVNAAVSKTNNVAHLSPIKKPIVFNVKLKNSPIIYPQIKGLKSQYAQKKINAILLKEAQSANKNRLKLIADEKIAKKNWKPSTGPWRPYEYKFTYKVPYNDNNHLSVTYYQYFYTGGAHGITNGSTFNFNTLTGDLIPLSKVIKGKQKAVQKYAYSSLQKKYKGSILIHSPSEILLNDKDRLWVFDKNGIKLIFDEYEVAAYAVGMPEIVIPFSVYK